MRLDEWIRKHYPKVWNEYLESEKVDTSPRPLQLAGEEVKKWPTEIKHKAKQRGYTKTRPITMNADINNITKQR